MAVPNRPAAGGVVESAWGDIVHDEVVAQEIQTGSAVCNVAGGIGTTVVTFPHPFASAPVVLVNVSANAGNDAHGEAESASATGFSLGVKATTNFGYTCYWFAYGPRA